MQLLTECPVCGKNQWKPFSKSDPAPEKLHHAQVQCVECGLIGSQPQATDAEANAYYAGSYYETNWPDPELVLRSNTAGYTASEFPLMESMGVSIANGKGLRVAGIGCGYGGMLLMLKERGFNVVGCDISMRALEFCKSKGLDVACGKSPGIPLAPSSADLVVTTHVIEHMSDPRAFVKELATLLRPGGTLVIVTEDACGSQERWDWLRARMKRSLPGFRTSTDHTFVFGPSQLARICRIPQLETIRVKAFSRPPLPESLHWKAYKGLFRTSDKIRGHGEYIMAVARRPA